MSNENGHSLSVTLKAGDAFSAPWVVVYGDNPDDVAFKLNNIEDVLKGAVSAAAALRGLHTLEVNGVPGTPVAPAETGGWSNSAPAAAPQWSQPQQQAAPAVQQVRLHPEGKPCACGQTLIFKEITSKKNGKTYQMWTCPSQQRKGDGHDSEFVD